MKKLLSLIFSLFGTFLLPQVVFAAAGSFKDFISQIIGLLANVMSLLYIAAFASFFWGLALFVLNTTDGSKRDEGKSWMWWSIVAIFVMITVWSIVGVLVSTFGLSLNVIPQLPH